MANEMASTIAFMRTWHPKTASFSWFILEIGIFLCYQIRTSSNLTVVALTRGASRAGWSWPELALATAFASAFAATLAVPAFATAGLA